MAKQQVTTVNLDNLNAWRTDKNPQSKAYVPKGDGKDNAAIQWAQENGYDNSKNYIHPIVQTQLDKANGIIPTTVSTQQSTTTQVVPPTQSLKPTNVDKETYDMLIGQGISQERINELYAPNEKNPFTRMWKEQQPEPEPIDEKVMTARRNMANLGEGVKVLGDMFGVSKGANIERRNAGDLTAKQQATEQSERDKYLAKLEQFNTGKRGAAEKDWMLSLQDKEKGLAQVQADMRQKKAEDAAALKAKLAADKLASDDDKWLKTYNLKAKGQEQANANAKERNRIAGIRANKDEKTDKKAEADKNMIQVEVGGGVYWVRKAFKDAIVGRARKNFGGFEMEKDPADLTGKTMRVVKDNAGVPVKKSIEKMTDDEIFNLHKDDYLRMDDNGKTLYIAKENIKPNSVLGTGGARGAASKVGNTTTNTTGSNKYSFKVPK